MVAAAALPSLMIYNTWTTSDYSGFTKNILSFQIVPTNPGGTPALLVVALIIHISTYCNQHVEGYEAAGFPTAALDIHIGERQMEYTQPTDVDLRKGPILADAGGQGAKWRLRYRSLIALDTSRGVAVF